MKLGPPRSRLLLTELILDLSIFAVCAVVCACILVQAWSISLESTQLTQAVTAAQSVAETWRATGTLPDSARPDENGLIAHCVVEDGLLTVVIQTRNGEPVYTLEEVAPFG